MMQSLQTIGQNAQKASALAARLTTMEKDNILNACAKALVDEASAILRANQNDMELARQAGLTGALLDRLALTEKRIEDMAKGLRQVAALSDPVGQVLRMDTMPNGLIVGKKRVPLGVICMIYEARPNVTADAFGLCLKAGNSVILRGGKEAIGSNAAIVSVFHRTLDAMGYDPYLVQLIMDTSRETAAALMRLNQYIDVLIPRGGAGLIRTVVENSTVPVIETGVGNCHIFVDESADLDNALAIILNAKTQRPGVCNACEKVLVHQSVADKFLPVLGKALRDAGVEIHGDEACQNAMEGVIPATEDDWGREYLDMIIGVRVVQSLEEALRHIAVYGTGHSEAILTNNYANAQRFLADVDAAAVYVNASTRFTDGGELGMGAEIGISTQKIHARGPMGLQELTSSKLIIYGNGQIRQ